MSDEITAERMRLYALYPQSAWDENKIRQALKEGADALERCAKLEQLLTEWSSAIAECLNKGR